MDDRAGKGAAGVARKVIASAPYMGDLRSFWHACSACGSPVGAADTRCPRCGAVFDGPVGDAVRDRRRG